MPLLIGYFRICALEKKQKSYVFIDVTNTNISALLLFATHSLSILILYIDILGVWTEFANAFSDSTQSDQHSGLKETSAPW